jgi:hypothetical protein
MFLTHLVTFDTSQIPQLWESSLRKYGGSDASTWCISSLIEIEAEKEQEAWQKADDKKALADAKSQGKEAMVLRKHLICDSFQINYWRGTLCSTVNPVTTETRTNPKHVLIGNALFVLVVMSCPI